MVLDGKCGRVGFIELVQLPHSALICSSVLKDFYRMEYISVFLLNSLCKTVQDILKHS